MEIVHISSLSPSSALPTDCGFKASVTLLWPFSSTTGQCALLLADPDARQRYQKGQVRVRFTGPSARQIAASGIGIGDSVQVALEGVQWLTEADTALVKTPGRSVDGELVFKNRLHMTITRGQTEPRTIDVDESTEHTSPKPSMLPPSTPVARSKPRTSFDAYGVAVYSSPAFMKRLRLSEGGTPYSHVAVSEDDDQDTVASRKRRRVSYKNVSEWKFDARKPSPEKDQIDVLDDADADEDLVAGAAVPEKATVENGNVTEHGKELGMQDAAESTEDANHQAERHAFESRSIHGNSTVSAQETVSQDHSIEIAEDGPLQNKTEAGAFLNSAAESSNAKESKESVVEAVVQQPAETTRTEHTSLGETSQALESSVISQFQISTSQDMPSTALPRLTILPTESELLEQMARARTVDRPTTPNLQPLLTEALPLPSPFPTSAQKIPSPIIPNIAGNPQIPENETVLEDAAETAVHARSVDDMAQEVAPASELQSKISQQGSDQQVEETSQTPRVVADIYDGYAEENPVVLSSSSEDDDDEEKKEEGEGAHPGRSLLAASSPVVADDQVVWRSRGDRFDDESSVEDESDEDMESSSEDSESDDASSAYNSDQIAALQEQSDDEGAVEEPDWDYLERKLEQEEAALQQSREDLTARDDGRVEAADDLEEGDEADDAVMHDDNSELDEEMLARSDDDSADDESDGTGYFDPVILPDTEEESEEESEIDAMDESYQPSMPENAMYSHPFDLDGARTFTETRTVLPSQAASEAGSAVGDETIAWRDRDAAVEALDQQMQQRQLQRTEQAVQAPPTQHVPPPVSSRLDVVELLDDSDSDEEDVDNLVPVPQATIDFLPSVGFVNHLLNNNNQKDAHLEISGSVTAQIRSEIKKISDQVDSQSSLPTKFNALRAICKIGVNVTVAAESGNMFAESVKYRLKEDEVLVNVCWRIYDQLSNMDRHHTGQPSDVLVALEELEEKRDYCFQGFADFLKHFKQNYHHLPVEMEKQLHQQSTPILPRVETQDAQEVESRPAAVKNKDSEQSSVPQIFETQQDPISNDSTDNVEQHLSSAVKEYTEQRTEAPEQSQMEPKVHTASGQADADTTLSSRSPAQATSVPADAVSFSRVSSMETDLEPQNETDANESEMMEVEAESLEPTDEHEIDPALLEGEQEIDPALLEQADSANSSQLEGHEIDPALLQEEHEIDPALLVERHDDFQSNSHPSPLHIDDAMSETSESATFSVAKEEEREQRDVEEEYTTAVTKLMEDEPSAPQDDGAAIAQAHEVPLKLEVQQSVEMDPDTVEKMEVDTALLQASLETTAQIQNSPQAKEELRPLSSSSFKTLSPTPETVQVQPQEPDAQPTAQKISDMATHMLDQPIEELDLSQVEPSWTSRFSQFSQSRSSRAHTRSETIPDSADEGATDLEAENNDILDELTSAEPATEAIPPQGTRGETLIQPSQELGTALSQLQNRRHVAPEMQSQLAAVEETASPEDKGVSDEMRSQAGLDDELLAEYVQVAQEPEAGSASPPRPGPSTPLSTKKSARPLTLFRGRKSISSRVSVGGDEQGTGDSEQQIQDNQQQVLQDEVMPDLSSRETEGSAMIEKVTEATIEGKGQSQGEMGASLAPASSTISEPQPQKAQEVTTTTEATAATKPEVSTAIEQAPEVEQASSNFQIKPTLKPFAEVEASLFGTPVKDKAAKPQEPQSAPSQSWRDALSSRMSEVPVIGSWFTPRRTTEVQKAATEHKATTSSTSLVEDTPTKAAVIPPGKQFSRVREKSISPPPLQRYASQGTSTSRSYFTPLAGLYQHLNQQSSLIDIVAVCTTATRTPERAKSGPKDYYTTFRIIDQPLHEYHTASQDEGTKDVKVEVFRPFKQSLPRASSGDVVLLRGFVVRSRNHKNYLLSTAASGWCIWRYNAPSSSALDYGGQEEEDDRPVWARKGKSQEVGEDGVREEVTGPPVEIGEEEREKVAMVRTWWEGLQKESTDKGKEEEEGHDITMIG
ncbi:hypothetical protein KCU85_g2970, partial [Aureobasidium melanogenum]